MWLIYNAGKKNMQYNYIKRINQIHQQNKTEFYRMPIELHNTDRNHIIKTQQELK